MNRLSPEIRPGQKRDEAAIQVYRLIEQALADIGTFVLAEAPVALVRGLYNQYTLSHTPLTGSVALYNAGLRVDPAHFNVSGAVITILTASITGLVLVDYRY